MKFLTLVVLSIFSAVLAAPTPNDGGDVIADGGAANSPGFLSGNNLQVPAKIPVNACGLGVTVIGALNPAFGNGCANE